MQTEEGLASYRRPRNYLLSKDYIHPCLLARPHHRKRARVRLGTTPTTSTYGIVSIPAISHKSKLNSLKPVDTRDLDSVAYVFLPSIRGKINEKNLVDPKELAHAADSTARRRHVGSRCEGVGAMSGAAAQRRIKEIKELSED